MYSAYNPEIPNHFVGKIYAIFPNGINSRIKRSSHYNVPERDQSADSGEMLPLGKNCDKMLHIATNCDRSVRFYTQKRINPAYTDKRIKYEIAYFNGPKQHLTPVLAYFSSLTQWLQLGQLTQESGHNSSNWDIYRGQLSPIGIIALKLSDSNGFHNLQRFISYGMHVISAICKSANHFQEFMNLGAPCNR